MKKELYFHIGNNSIINKNDIIGIFDLDKITVFKVNRNYLSNVEKRGKIVSVAEDIPKSCIVCCGKDLSSERVYLSQLLTSTLHKRHLSNSFEV